MEAIGVELAYGSRLSLHVNAIKASALPYHARFDQLIVNIDGGELELGPCRFLPGDQGDRFHGRLVFETEVYNFDALFDKGKVRNLERALNNLPLVLAQHRTLYPDYKRLVSEMTYELNTHRSFFEILDQELKDEPSDVAQAALSVIMHGEGRRFMACFENWLHELEDATADFSRGEHEKHAFHLRKQTWHLIMESPFLSRTNIKPRGYAGDSEMMRMLYSNDWEGNTIFGKLLHKHAVETPAAQAVRNRRRFIEQTVRKCAQEFRANRKPIRVMSVACGPAAEMQDVYASPEVFPQYDVTLLDQDINALREASNGIAEAERRHQQRACITYLNESVRTLLRTSELTQHWGRFNLIYTMGLFDYLTEPVAKAVASKLFGLLHPGGELVIGNFHTCNPTRTYMEYWMDWVLYYRTEDDMHGLLADIPGSTTRVEFEDSGSQMFLRARKA